MKAKPYVLSFIILMAACKPVSNPVATMTVVPGTASETYTPSLTITPDSPTPLLDRQIFDAWQTQVAQATPIRTPVVPTYSPKYPLVYVKDGNLYFQSSKDQSLQLTKDGKVYQQANNSGEIERNAILSEDNQIIVFFRGKTGNDMYSIYSDGSQERALVTSRTTLLTGKGDIYTPHFVPGTHLLLFNTYLCEPKKGLYDYADCTIDLYSIDTDTGKINDVVRNINGNSMSMWEVDYAISPNGEYVAMAGDGHVNIYQRAASHFQIAFPNVLSYPITLGDEYVARQYWLPDSSGLIIIAAADGQANEPATPPAYYVAYRYTIGNKQAVPISMSNPILWNNQHDDWCLSPDMNWILYTSNESGDFKDNYQYYLENLRDGRTQVFTPWWDLFSCEWSPDSRHFAFTNTPAVIVSIDGQPVPIGGYFGGWIDATHYYYSVIEKDNRTITIYIGELPKK
jgi:hypothetical protein